MSDIRVCFTQKIHFFCVLNIFSFFRPGRRGGINQTRISLQFLLCLLISVFPLIAFRSWFILSFLLPFRSWVIFRGASDDSFSEILIFVFVDYQEITSVEAREDAGWFPISLLFDGYDFEMTLSDAFWVLWWFSSIWCHIVGFLTRLNLYDIRNPTVARIIQVSVNSCHQKGRDVHLRQMLIFGPKRCV